LIAGLDGRAPEHTAMNELKNINNFHRLSHELGSAGQPTAEQLRSIAEAGYEVVVNLALHDAPYALEDEAAVVQALGLEYLHLPVDWEAPTRADLEAFMRVMEARQGRRIFVHCAENKRVSVFVALHRILRQGWSVDAALAVTRDVWEPNPVWQAFIEQTLDAGRTRAG
jgi:protein tyrosine phosphatase (PTP) superfamily phosphohydrolase (DUF442 family)